MKKLWILLIGLIMAISLSGCIRKIEQKGAVNLYPAFEMERNEKLWGYIDDKGKFIVEPKYDLVHDFTDEGLAKVELEGLSGVINRDGEEILAPSYQTISEFKDGYFVGFDGKVNQLFNYKGDIQFFGDGEYMYIGPNSDSLFTVAVMDEENNMKMGYIDKKGVRVIEPRYSRAYNFINGKAIVQENEKENFKIIDKDDKTIKELDFKDVKATSNDGIYLFKDEDELYGLLDENGEIIIPDKFDSIVDMDGELIVVSILENEKHLFGVINKNGNYIIDPKYKAILSLGEGYFAISEEESETNGSLYAIANNEGEILTEFKYYGAGGFDGKIKNNLISVSDGDKTYAIDLKGEKSLKVPEVSGVGEVNFNGKVVKSKIEDTLAYYNTKGELIWEEINTFLLREGAEVIEKKFLEGRTINVNYPVVQGLKNEDAEDIINEKLYKYFTSSYGNEEKLKSSDYIYYRTNYKINKVNDLLIIEQASEFIDDENRIPHTFGQIYNINLRNGDFYELEDLFKKDSEYVRILSDMLRGQMEDKIASGTSMYDLEGWEEIRKNQDFIAQMKTIDIYLKPGEIISYSEKFPKFTIEQTDIEDILDYGSEFWWAYSVNKGF
jgi:hypothetical protein